jgi:hypothetical protein
MTTETPDETMVILAKAHHATRPVPEPSAIVWQCVAMRLQRVPTKDEQAAFRKAWSAEHAAWIDLLATHVPDRKETP